MKRAAAVYTALAALQRGLALLLLPFLTRAMSVEEFGATSILAAGYALFVILLSFAFEPAVLSASIRELSDPTERDIIRAARLALLLVSPVLAVLLALGVWFSGQSLFGVGAELWAIEIVACGVTVFGLTYAMPRLRAHQNLRAYSIVAIATIVAALGSKLGLMVFLPLGPLGWALSDLIAGLAGTLSALVVLRRDTLHRGPFAIRRLAGLSLPLLPHLASLWIINSISRPLIEAVLTLRDVGLYSAAASASGAAMVICLEINRATNVEYAHDRFPAPSPRSAQAMKLQLSASVALAVLVCALTPAYVNLVLPPEYDAVQPLLAILSLTVVFWTVYAIATAFTTLAARITKWTWTGSLGGVVVTVLGTLGLAATWGVLGVAVAAVLAQITIAALAIVLHRALGLRLDWREGGVTGWWVFRAAAALGLAVAPDLFQWGVVPWLLATAGALMLSGGDLIARLRPRSSGLI